MATVEEIKAFWNQRAEELGTDCTATLRETYLRILEINAIAKYLDHGLIVADIGCGNGFSTIEFAKRFKTDFIGFDYSEKMIFYANSYLMEQSEGTLKGNVGFEVGDILKLETPNRLYDIVLTERCIQNIPTWDLQRKAVIETSKILKTNGLLIMTEGSLTGAKRLNKLRSIFGKPEMENIIPWHNRFLDDSLLINDSTINEVYDFEKLDHFCSTYMLITRLIGPNMANLAMRFPNYGKFGYIKIYVWRKR